ncbi:MAG: homoserine dehydrogenase [Clostridia bacterium]
MNQMGVAVVGCGVVGSGVVKMLTQNRAKIARAAGCDVRLKYIVDIKEVAAPEGTVVTADFDLVLADPEVQVIVETIGGAGIALKYTQRALEMGKSVVTSNKELVATSGDAFKALACEKNAWYLYEAAVCGGVPVLRPIKTCLAGNHITRLSGIVNGSTNYLITRMVESGMSFQAALGEAKELGYVEQNPDADILGLDARRKLAILANAAFGAKLSDDALIPTEGIAHLNVRDMVCAKALGGQIKLIAHAERTRDNWTGWVRPALVANEHPLAMVKDVFNGLCVTGDCVEEVMFYGRGAGMMPTASAIVGDLIEMARAPENPISFDAEADVPAFVKPDCCLARLAMRVEEGVLALCDAMPIDRVESRGAMTAVLTREAPLGELLQKAAGLAQVGVQAGIPLIVL